MRRKRRFGRASKNNTIRIVRAGDRGREEHHMGNKRIFMLAALPALALMLGCKKAGTPKATIPAAAATVETRPAGETASGVKQPAGLAAKEVKQAYEKKETWFSLPNAAGGRIDLADYGGKAVMLMFFTETCPYCRMAAPFIEKMNKTYKAGGLNVLGISLNGDAAATAGFVKYFGVTFPVACEGKQAARQYGAQGVPFIFLLKKDHTVYNVWAGYDEAYNKDIESGIAAVIK